DLERAEAHIKLCVDTQPPQVTLRALPARDGVPGVEWQIRDDNLLDLDSLRLEYSLVGGNQWQPLSAERRDSGRYTWASPPNGALEVRLRVKDKAGNLGEATVPLMGGAGGDPRNDTPPRDTGVPGVRLVNSKRISFNFEFREVGKSGVSAVQVWMTRDNGKGWSKHSDKNDPQPKVPIVIDVAEEGLYGF